MGAASGDEWRNREETLEHLIKAIPLNKRGHGAEQWRMSLRDSWERWVPVGSIFSGLFAAVYDKPSVRDSRYRRMLPLEVASLFTAASLIGGGG